jgi:hypothetical protein
VDADLGGTNRTYAAALADCESWGGTLLSVNSDAEQQWLTSSSLFANRDCWIGLSASVPIGSYSWETGEELTYTHWVSGEPSNTSGELCVTLQGNYAKPSATQVGFWNNVSCSDARCYYCER